ncbi:MAG: hypothetical protein JSU70_01595 [Phycisphaerales bacterium]|nr:MAG: hypothetical protein JSV36_03570 [Anaerolineae bacterium]UCG58202.1 MAG: hypothetical protein JSU70_01595 [Phycisphaerales bacterium]
MNIDPETGGKILGMVMAYFASFLGLLLAYYNYKKRGPRADKSSQDASKGE